MPWVYIRCSVDIENKLYFHYDQFLKTSEIFLNTTLKDIPETGTASLKFVNGNQNRGIIFFRLLRLFSCYDCQIPDIYRLNWITPLAFSDQFTWDNLLYHIDGKIKDYDSIDRSDVDAEKKQKFKYIKDVDVDVLETDEITPLTTSEFLGYNLIDLSPEKYLPLNSPKSTNNLYPENNELWSGLIKLNEVEDVKIDNIAPSFNGRYTIEFWFIVENISKLSKGFHIIWRNLASVTLMQESSLSMFCWPQDFKLNSEIGSDISTIYGSGDLNRMLGENRVINYEKKQRAKDINNTWMYVRCAVNNGDRVFYSRLEDNTAEKIKEVEIKPDVMYTVDVNNFKNTVTNDYPFRYYFQNGEKTYLMLAGMSKNVDCTIYVRNIWLFSEYLPITMDFRHM